jgi:glycosyltransferase involved in cell wall biosynthesis
MPTVLINAGPWLPVPPVGYGGIENVVAALVPELRLRGARVILATVGSSRLDADEHLSVFPDGQFAHLQRPYNQSCGLAHAHLQEVVRALRERADIDLVHDHVEAVGLSVLSALGDDAPPVLHTLHWDLAKHPELYGHFDGRGRVFVNGVSANQLTHAPAALRAHALGWIHLATPLAVGADRRSPEPKGDHFVVLGRITPGKGQHIAAKLAHDVGFDLVLAGPVGPHRHPADLAAAVADPETARNPDVRYWLEEVRPHVDGVRVRWVGTLTGQARDHLVARARGALFPLRWEEPGGTAVIESLALGTPVIGLARGCLPELVDSGLTGLLCATDDELADAIGAVGQIDPRACQVEAATRFTPAVMAEAYLRLYEQTLHQAHAVAQRNPADRSSPSAERTHLGGMVR